MNIAIIGGAGFIGINLAIKLSLNPCNHIMIIDRNKKFFEQYKNLNLRNVDWIEDSFDKQSEFDNQVKRQDYIYHLASTNIPGTSNQRIPEELDSNVIVTARLLDACVRQRVKKVIFISSGGTVYGKKGKCPIEENMVTYPITSYGIQKIAIEKLVYLYHYQSGLDYRVIRLANPYGPYQRPNGQLGVVTTFVYKTMTDGKIIVYGDGTVVRDFIYIDDAVKGIINIAEGECEYRVFNLGSGKGTSVNEVIDIVKKFVRNDVVVEYVESRPTDVPENYLDISRYEKYYGKLNPISLEEGVQRTATFLRNNRWTWLLN